MNKPLEELIKELNIPFTIGDKLYYPNTSLNKVVVGTIYNITIRNTDMGYEAIATAYNNNYGCGFSYSTIQDSASCLTSEEAEKFIAEKGSEWLSNYKKRRGIK